MCYINDEVFNLFSSQGPGVFARWESWKASSFLNTIVLWISDPIYVMKAALKNQFINKTYQLALVLQTKLTVFTSFCHNGRRHLTGKPCCSLGLQEKIKLLWLWQHYLTSMKILKAMSQLLGIARNVIFSPQSFRWFLERHGNTSCVSPLEVTLTCWQHLSVSPPPDSCWLTAFLYPESPGNMLWFTIIW